ncbi:unnamed protein product [Leptosia nina]|uniref:Uncharacterized protein n=1 Tax=Leptosia nina TaxID=320188 RepID=A0AAV1J302_9NEOP
MDAVYPAAASVLTRGRRRRRAEPRLRYHTMPVTFAEIKEVDEEKENDEKVPTAISSSNVSAANIEERRRRPDVLDETLSRQFTEFRNRRTRRRRDILQETDEIEDARAQSEPSDATALPT